MQDKNFYLGHTTNLEKRLAEHNKGKVESTRRRRPFQIIYYEACLDQQDALKRERYLKTTWGKRYLRNRLANFLRTI
jgi:putative endonuclease